ncbi:hypothetical protein LRAMOSA09877 [Lichtheimia ramosa]|uniref:60S ribosomal protein L7 n=1 Tax=Lichtheimia ramosa TaxID=688394 RepID=A0A077WLG5_9FUNG|nr:hypothetical protein LRAMOSA09877 [Lichtheimia ramosa]
MESEQKLNYVPETLLKKRKINERAAVEAAQKRAEMRKKQRKASLRTTFKRADQFVKEYRKQEKESARLRVLSKQRKTGKAKHATLESANPNQVLLVIRTKNTHNVHPKIKKALRHLRLSQMNEGVFVRLDENTRRQLKTVLAYITYGEPNLNTVRDLLLKRGFTTLDNKRTAISDNMMVEEQLGQYGIICVEDMIHEIFKCGEHFDAVAKFILPFHLHEPVRRWREKRFKTHMAETEGEIPYETDVNKLVELMN